LAQSKQRIRGALHIQEREPALSVQDISSAEGLF
jgi:hypothetical protein